MFNVKILLEEYFKNIQIVSIKKIGEGNDSIAYLVNNNYIFKFPKHEKASINIQKEIKILQILEDKMTLEIPRVEYIGTPA